MTQSAWEHSLGSNQVLLDYFYSISTPQRLQDTFAEFHFEQRRACPHVCLLYISASNEHAERNVRARWISTQRITSVKQCLPTQTRLLGAMEVIALCFPELFLMAKHCFPACAPWSFHLWSFLLRTSVPFFSCKRDPVTLLTPPPLNNDVPSHTRKNSSSAVCLARHLQLQRIHRMWTLMY